MAREAAPPITPESRVGDILKHYPELEEVLMGLSPTFRALRNPILRRTVAKVATLRQVAKVGNLSVGAVVGRLREAVGQAPEPYGDEPASAEGRPAWADPAAVARTFDARPLIEDGGHPLERVMEDLAVLLEGEVYALVTPFVPQPLVDLARAKGFQTHSESEGPELWRTFFVRRGDRPGGG
ncbi:MAG: DUF1858 domain-containing protein [Deltaproteobacteria bacterium]|nr:DUF1858 domain-containing protein [Deltaproteobacteria bacterium]